MTSQDLLPFSAAADRNKGPILDALQRLLPQSAAVIEIASGTGQHALHFATENPHWHWQPTEADPRLLPVLAQRCAGVVNLREPLPLDVLSQPWPALPGPFDAAFCANLLHISPWAVCAALMQGLAPQLTRGGALLLYGPYVVDGEPTAPSNLAFDADLRSRNAAWGLRRLGDVVTEAQRAGLAFEQRVTMPANNLLLVFRQASRSSHPNSGG